MQPDDARRGVEQLEPTAFGHRLGLDVGEKPRQPEDRVAGEIGARDAREADALLLRQFEGRDEAEPVDHRIGDLRGDDLAAEPVAFDRAREARLHRLGEGGVEDRRQRGIARDRRGLDRRLQGKLGVAEDDGQFGAGEAVPVLRAAREFVVGS